MLNDQGSALILQAVNMDTDVVQQFLNFFQDFRNLCQLENWPNNDTREVEIRNSFIIAQHVEKCLDRLQKRNVINEFVSVLNSNDDNSNIILKCCLSNPPKYVLKKIINSEAKINQLDIGFKIFLELFSEDKLEICLSELMVEAASKETLLKNLKNQLSKDDILKFKSKLFISELDSANADITKEIINNFNQEIVEVLVVSMLNNEPKYMNAVKKVIDFLIGTLLCRDSHNKGFWKALFKVDDRYFIQMCVEHSNIFTYIVEALLDSGKLLSENMSSECFYIDLSYSELVGVVQRICTNGSLKCQFFSIVRDHDSDMKFWENIL